MDQKKYCLSRTSKYFTDSSHHQWHCQVQFKLWKVTTRILRSQFSSLQKIFLISTSTKILSVSKMQCSEAYWCHSPTNESCAHLVPYTWLWSSNDNRSLTEHTYKVQIPNQTSGEDCGAAVWQQLQSPSWTSECHRLMCTHQEQREPTVISNAVFRWLACRKAGMQQGASAHQFVEEEALNTTELWHLGCPQNINICIFPAAAIWAEA